MLIITKIYFAERTSFILYAQKYIEDNNIIMKLT